MRTNLKEKPVITVTNQSEFKKLTDLGKADSKTLLSPKNYRASVAKAKKLMQKSGFDITR